MLYRRVATRKHARYTAVAVDELGQVGVHEPGHLDEEVMILREVSMMDRFVMGNAVPKLAQPLYAPHELLTLNGAGFVGPFRKRLVQA